MSAAFDIVEIEAYSPGVPVFRVTGYAERGDLHVYRDQIGRWHSMFPVKREAALFVGARAERGWPTVQRLIARAWPELVP